MQYKIVLRNIGRAGSFSKMKAQQQEWDRRFGSGKWETGYEVNDKFLTREQAIAEIYDTSYFAFLDSRPELVKQLVAAKDVFNPHAYLSNSTDIQAETVRRYMAARKLAFTGEKYLPIGSYQPRFLSADMRDKIKRMGLEIVNDKIKYPAISYTLSPFKIPCVLKPGLSIEDFWQSGAKCLAIKIS